MSEQPFGNIAKVSRIAKKIIKWTDEPLKILDSMSQAKAGNNRPIIDR